MGELVKIKINNNIYEAEKGEPVLKVAKREGIDIPSLCYHETLKPQGACRLCLVEVIEGKPRGITTSCTLLSVNGLEVMTDTPEVQKHRKIILEFYLAQAPGSQEIKRLAEKYGVTEVKPSKEIDPNDPLGGKCILCGLCVRVCDEIMGVNAISYIGRGNYTKINTPYFEKSEVCIGCKACADVCPTSAIQIEDINDKRVMKSWSKTEARLKRCERCGKYFAPNLLIKHTCKIYDELDKEVKNLCPDCRRKVLSKKVFISKKRIIIK